MEGTKVSIEKHCFATCQRQILSHKVVNGVIQGRKVIKYYVWMIEVQLFNSDIVFVI
jgi:hypothetical protein